MLDLLHARCGHDVSMRSSGTVLYQMVPDVSRVLALAGGAMEVAAAYCRVAPAQAIVLGLL